MYPKIFRTGVIPENINKYDLLADALDGWSAKFGGHPEPPLFNEIMKQIGDKLNVIPVPEILIELADQFYKEDKQNSFEKSMNFIINLNLN